MHTDVQRYYGSIVNKTEDLQTDVCTTAALPAPHLRAALSAVHPEVRDRYYGCGTVFPHELRGRRVLDLGCGTGRDCFVLAQLVGADGRVVGVDMTEEQLAVGERYLPWHMERFGYATPNVEFHKGYIERLDELNFAAGSFDVIVSNCVINLALDKAAVLNAAQRLLVSGGELYFSDIYADRRVPRALASDPVLYGECLGGALYWHDFLTLGKRAGFLDPRLIDDHPVGLRNDAIAARVAPIQFYSATYRLFKLAELEPACEDYGQAVAYLGTIPEAPAAFQLDHHHRFERGKLIPVCGNTWRMLFDTRFLPHFSFHGDWNTHYGIFAGCGIDLPFATNRSTSAAASCC